MRRIIACVSSAVPSTILRCYRICTLLVLSTVLIFILTREPKQSLIYSETFLVRLKGPLRDDDPELLHYIQNEILEPPSREPYNLTGDFNRLRHQIMPTSEKFYRNHLSQIFKDKNKGVFVEAGALDGETMSITLDFEKEKDWTGLLVEVDKVSFKGLRSKHRKAWSANVCLSTDPYPAQELFEEVHSVSTIETDILAYQQRSMSKLTKFSNLKGISQRNWSWVQCLPLQSLLKALNVSTINLLVLDLEGAEMSVLRHLDLVGFNIEVICLEWKKYYEANKIIQELEARNYVLLVQETEDFIFAKKGSPYEHYKP
ncbi:uncharacterized protein [Palaemon carinicauda]|uniref:uncharacterized protein n=1 Tax=Palaemon carinicauda TaxID=392227 RepID=UPI0035B63FF6